MPWKWCKCFNIVYQLQVDFWILGAQFELILKLLLENLWQRKSIVKSRTLEPLLGFKLMWTIEGVEDNQSKCLIFSLPIAYFEHSLLFCNLFYFFHFLVLVELGQKRKKKDLGEFNYRYSFITGFVAVWVEDNKSKCLTFSLPIAYFEHSVLFCNLFYFSIF